MYQAEKRLSGYAHPKRRTEADGFRPDIEGLRGIAVALVVLFHAGLLSNAPYQLTGGFIGVDLFFVVSGFLITGLLIRERERNGRISFAKFYARRVRRILPAAAVVLIVCLPIAYQLSTLVSRSSVMEDGASAALSIANIRFAQTTDYFNPVNYSPFLHFWSLGVEEQFYFIWPALMFVVAWKWPRPGAAVALASVIVVSFMASVYETDQNASTAFYMLPTRAWQLAAGGLLAVMAGSSDVLPRSMRSMWANVLAFGGWAAFFALLTASYAIDSKLTPYPGTAAVVPTIAGVLLIASGESPIGPGMLLRLTPIRFIGKISYSLYLWHWPVLILGGLYLVGPLDSISVPQAIALAVLSVPIAAASWYFVEEPFRRGRIPLPRPSRVVAVGVAIMSIVAIMGASFDVAAQNDLKRFDNPIADATPTPDVRTPEPTATPVPTPTVTLAPDATPSPTPFPLLTAAVTMPPPADPPTSFAVTSAIRPGLGKAATDYEAPWRNNCLGWKATTTPNTSSRCVYGDPNGTYTVALVGDSHASALFPGVNVVAAAHGWKLIPYLKIDCSFLDFNDLVYYGPPTVPYPECMSWNKTVLSRLAKSPPDLIILSMSRWIFTDNNAEETVTNQTNALVRQIQKLPESSRVVIIQDPPLPTTFKIPDCLSVHLNDYTKCAYSKKTGFGSYMGTREKNAAKATGVGLIDLTDAVCPGSGNYCPVVIDDMIVWRDEHHLTATFAASLAPAIDEQLVAILNDWDMAAAGVTPAPSEAPTAAPGS
jgi:peptidoglycan/LPS O-acetylase OafA/YrhL